MIASLAGWLPAIILPVASGMQLYKILKYKRAGGVSSSAWFLFALANVGTYVFIEKYWAIQSILAFLLTAILNMAIAVYARVYKR